MSTPAVIQLLVSADELADRREWGSAFQTLQQACAIAPADPVVLDRLGSYLLRYGYPVEKWLPLFERAGKIPSANAEIRMHLGLGYAVSGKIAEAAGLLQAALRMPGCPPQAATLLALLCLQEQRKGDARDVLCGAIRTFPGDTSALGLLAQIHELEGDGPSARILYREVLRWDPANARASVALKRMALRERRGDPPEPPAEPATRSAVMLVDDRRIDRRVLDEARSLGMAGWDVTVVAGEPPDENPFWDEECYPDVRIIRANERMLSVPCVGELYRYTVPWYRKKASAVLRGEHLSRILPKQEWRRFLHDRRSFYIIAADIPASVYVAHDLPQVPVAAMAAALHGARLVYDSHELYPEQSFVLKDRPLLEALERHVAPLADSVIVVNESMRSEFAARYGVASEVILNCPSIDATAFPVPRTDRLRESLRLPRDTRILLYQGNIVARIRNLENIIEAMGLLSSRDVALVLMGPDNGGGNELVALARERGLLGRSVYFHPPVKQDELLSYTASADVGLIPYTAVDWNTKFCTPNKLYEFIVAELPILANALPELTRFVSGQGIGLNLPMESATEVARAIDAMFGADIGGFRARLAEVSPRFLWQNHEGPAVVDMYDHLFDRPARDGRTVERDARPVQAAGVGIHG
ncbi:MAG TPA: glycosyltransferase [Bacteroidota bacterium]|nr:glycosyltransferase [Bacteroidota bacterium]